MSMQQIAEKGLVLLGCGKMGSAMLQGWLADGIAARLGLGDRPAPVGLAAGDRRADQ